LCCLLGGLLRSFARCLLGSLFRRLVGCALCGFTPCGLLRRLLSRLLPCSLRGQICLPRFFLGPRCFCHTLHCGSPLGFKVMFTRLLHTGLLFFHGLLHAETRRFPRLRA
jgi:hypothetical protein